MNGEVMLVELNADGLMFDDEVIREEVRHDGVWYGVVDESQEAPTTRRAGSITADCREIREVFEFGVG